MLGFLGLGCAVLSASLSCSPGEWRPPSAHVCVKCDAGTWSYTGSSARCTPCAAGKWSAASASTCVACPSGRYGLGGSVSDACAGKCAAGRFGGGDSSWCRDACPAGFGSVLDAAAGTAGGGCGKRCPPGRFSRKGAGLCVLCPGGKFAAASGSRLCKMCPPGHFTRHLHLTYSPNKPARYVGIVGTVSCVPCARGRNYAALGASDSSFCALCSPGKFSHSLGAAHCFSCPVGKFGGTSGRCSSCSQGMFQSHRGASSCEVCPAGRFAPRSASSCGVCPRGYSCAAGAGEGARCPAGSYAPQAQGDSRCTPCPAGTFGLGTVEADLRRVVTGGSVARLACSPCPAGRYSNMGASSAQCTGECSAGRWGRMREKTALCYGKCAAGRFSRGGASSPRCTAACPAGSFSHTGATGCTACTAGWFASKAGAAHCTRCPAGKHSQPHRDPHSGKMLIVACFGCPRGKWAVPASGASGGAARCAACPAGTYGNFATTAMHSSKAYSQDTVCRKCPVGRYGEGGSPTDSCAGECAAGRFGSGGSTTKFCSGTCEAGTFGRAGAETPSCSGRCEAGRWSTRGSKSCTSCEPGRFTQREGAPTEKACAGCPQGKYAPFSYAGARRCDSCAAGTHPARSFAASHCDPNEPTPSPTPVPPTPKPTSGPTPRPFHVCEQVHLGHLGHQRTPPHCAVCGVFRLCNPSSCKGSGWFHLGLGSKSGADASRVGFKPVYRATFSSSISQKGRPGAAAWGEAAGSNGFAGQTNANGARKSEKTHVYLYFYAKYAQWVVSEQLLAAPFLAASRDAAPVPQLVQNSFSLSHGDNNEWWTVANWVKASCVAGQLAGAAAKSRGALHGSANDGEVVENQRESHHSRDYRFRMHADLLGFSAARFGIVGAGFTAALGDAMGLRSGAVRLVGRPQAHLWPDLGRSGLKVEFTVTQESPCETVLTCKTGQTAKQQLVHRMERKSFKLRQHDGFLLLAAKDFKLSAPTLIPSERMPQTARRGTSRVQATIGRKAVAVTSEVDAKPTHHGHKVARMRVHAKESTRSKLHQRLAEEVAYIRQSPALACGCILLTCWCCSLMCFCFRRSSAAQSVAIQHKDEVTPMALEASLEAEMRMAANWLSTEYAENENQASSEHRTLLKGIAQGGWDATQVHYS